MGTEGFLKSRAGRLQVGPGWQKGADLFAQVFPDRHLSLVLAAINRDIARFERCEDLPSTATGRGLRLV